MREASRVAGQMITNGWLLISRTLPWRRGEVGWYNERGFCMEMKTNLQFYTIKHFYLTHSNKNNRPEMLFFQAKKTTRFKNDSFIYEQFNSLFP